MNVRFEDIWHFLRDEHGWAWRGGPAPYNNVYVRPGVEHMNAVGVDVDFFDDDNKLFAEAKRLGFVVKQSQEEDEGESGSDADNSLICSRRGGRGGGFAQKQVDAANSMAHISLSVAEDCKEGEEAVGEIERCGEEEEEEQLASEAEDDESILDQDDTALCGVGNAKTLTLQSMHLCARLIGRFAEQSQQSEDASFNNLLWTPLWTQLRDSQGGDEAELKWTYTRSKGKLAQRSFWYVAPQSNGAEGNPGVDYFETEEAVVLRVLKEVRQFDPSLLTTREAEVAVFEAVLTRALENNVSYNDSRSNPDIGVGRRNRRKSTGENSPFVYSPPNKKAKARKAKAPTKPKISPQKSKQSSSPKRKNKSVAFTDPLPMSQNTLQGVKSLLMLNHSSVAVSVATAAATSEEEKHAPCMPTYEDVVTKKGIESLRKERLRQLQDITPSPKKRAAAREAPSSSSSGRKKQKVNSPFRDNAPSSIDSRLSQVPYQLCENLEDMSQSDVSSSFSRRASIKRGDGGKARPLDGLSFFGSGLDKKHRDLIQELGGKYLNDVSLADTEIFGKLFFVSHVKQRRKLKYILASSLGVPMLHYSWLTAIKEKFLAFDDEDTDAAARADFVKQLPYDSKLFKAMRLPVGLSIKSGLYQLQKARHAKRWCRPGYENGELVFKGLKLTVALENEKSEAAW